MFWWCSVRCGLLFSLPGLGSERLFCSLEQGDSSGGRRQWLGDHILPSASAFPPGTREPSKSCVHGNPLCSHQRRPLFPTCPAASPGKTGVRSHRGLQVPGGSPSCPQCSGSDATGQALRDWDTPGDLLWSRHLCLSPHSAALTSRACEAGRGEGVAQEGTWAGPPDLSARPHSVQRPIQGGAGEKAWTTAHPACPPSLRPTDDRVGSTHPTLLLFLSSAHLKTDTKGHGRTLLLTC